MEEYLVTAVGYLRLVVETIGAAVVGFGVLATTYCYVLTLVGAREYTNKMRYGSISGATSLLDSSSSSAPTSSLRPSPRHSTMSYCSGR